MLPRSIVKRPGETVADLSATRTVGTQAIGDVGALIWVAEQLDLIGQIDRACGNLGARGSPSVAELAVAVAIQRACSPGPKRDLAEFLNGSVPRLSCLPASVFTGQDYHRVAGKSLMSNWNKRRSRLPKRRWHGSSFQPTCWRSIPLILTPTLRP
jgi:hypothetical protein